MDAIADMRRKNNLQPESTMELKETQLPPLDKSDPHQPSEDESSKAAHDVAELKDYVRVSLQQQNGC